ncbi:MAG: hypothetical protein KGH59_00675 [Candidatus Micrarchaeota archaeon]|nr:hypothetical protein [Candidatus Micrarchaeota archaeon]MDE1804285.1 hypothetical protein [Candidatus Micrarchaeota archaeon]MDE1846850.1 hypothetical protein [Candidatus Micrarchaeota archaeon]
MAELRNVGENIQILGTLVLLIGGLYAFSIAHPVACNLACTANSTACCATKGVFLYQNVDVALSIMAVAVLFALITRGASRMRHQLSTATTMFSVVGFLSLLLGAFTYASSFPHMQIVLPTDELALFATIVGMLIVLQGSVLVMREHYRTRAAKVSRAAPRPARRAARTTRRATSSRRSRKTTSRRRRR